MIRVCRWGEWSRIKEKGSGKQGKEGRVKPIAGTPWRRTILMKMGGLGVFEFNSVRSSAQYQYQYIISAVILWIQSIDIS